MSRSWLGTILIVVAVVAGVVVANGLLQWETADRNSRIHFFPSATPLPPVPSPTSAPDGSSSQNTLQVNVASEGAAGDAAAGGRVFATSCGGCHPNGNAGAGPSLKSEQFKAKYKDDAALRNITRKGQGAMPGFANLSDSDFMNLVAYLRSL